MILIVYLKHSNTHTHNHSISPFIPPVWIENTFAIAWVVQPTGCPVYELVVSSVVCAPNSRGTSEISINFLGSANHFMALLIN